MCPSSFAKKGLFFSENIMHNKIIEARQSRQRQTLRRGS